MDFAAQAQEGISPSKDWFTVAPQVPTISKSDEEFREEKIEFVFGAEGIDLAELNDLFERVSPASCLHNLLSPLLWPFLTRSLSIPRHPHGQAFDSRS